MRSWDEIVALTHLMMRDRSPVLLKMRDVLTKYEGDTVLLLPELPTEPVMPQITPLLVAEAIDKTAQRAASVPPMLSSPALDPTKALGRRSREYGDVRRRALQATYKKSKWDLAMRRCYRQLSAYFTTAAFVRPDFKRQMPHVLAGDPLSTFAETVAENELRAPEYVATVSRHSGESIVRKWPQAGTSRGGPIAPNRPDMQWDLVEWMDTEQTVFGLLGPTYETEMFFTATDAPSMQLSPVYENRIGMVPAIVPANVTLSRVSSRLSNVLGMLGWMEKVSTLDLIAQEKATFPDMVILGAQGQTPRLIDNEWHDGRTGIPNLIEGAQAVEMLRSTPDQRSSQTVDRLERNFRVSTGTLPQYGGESFSALRTGRAMDSMLQASVDPMIHELHQVMVEWMPELNEVILRTYKAYWPNKSYSMHTGRLGDREIVKFTPTEHFETFETVVQYPVPGADMVQTTQTVGAMAGANMISLQTARQMHPLISDPEQEKRDIALEQIDATASEAFRMQMIQGQIPLTVQMLVRKHIEDGEDWGVALTKADEEMRRLQAQTAPPPGPGQMIAPEAAPGMAGGPGAMQQPELAPTPEVNVPQGADRMRQLMTVMGG